jgi:hypothetical protein
VILREVSSKDGIAVTGEGLWSVAFNRVKGIETTGHVLRGSDEEAMGERGSGRRKRGKGKEEK